MMRGPMRHGDCESQTFGSKTTILSCLDGIHHDMDPPPDTGLPLILKLASHNHLVHVGTHDLGPCYSECNLRKGRQKRVAKMINYGKMKPCFFCRTDLHR